MGELIHKFHPVIIALAAGCFTWIFTAFGSALIFLKKDFSQKLFDAMLGFAGGIMIAASFWSLLSPAIEITQTYHSFLSKFIPAIGFLLGAGVLRIIDMLLPHLHLGFPANESEGIKTSWHRSILLVLAITLHNIPEGLAVGVAVGSTAQGYSEATLASAIALSLGIGIQNIPEGFAVAISLYREKLSRFRSFWFGQLSGIVEPIAAIIGCSAVLWAHYLLPYALSFAAGAMIFVVVEEVIPEAQRNGNVEYATGGTIIGFLVMMMLDTVFT
ncbi:MAG: ZIP family metal transporter [candidate division WOR-3 bacterium]|nr:ZIP family metal transporter [candidate division WOR-3 bacterium]